MITKRNNVIIIIIIACLIVPWQAVAGQLSGDPAVYRIQEYLKMGRPAGGKVLVCIGDSITQGDDSVNYENMLAGRLHGRNLTIVNAGNNGDLTDNVIRRLDDIIACNPDFITLMIGTNDAHANFNTIMKCLVYTAKGITQEPTPERYRLNLAYICDTLKSRTHARIALLSLPPLNEDVNHPVYLQTTRYSGIVHDIATSRQVYYLPLHETMDVYLRCQNHEPGTAYYENTVFPLSMWIVFQHSVLGYSLDAISRANGLLLLTDLIHLNSKGAGMVADQIQGFLYGVYPEN